MRKNSPEKRKFCRIPWILRLRPLTTDRSLTRNLRNFTDFFEILGKFSKIPWILRFWPVPKYNIYRQGLKWGFGAGWAKLGNGTFSWIGALFPEKGPFSSEKRYLYFRKSIYPGGPGYRAGWVRPIFNVWPGRKRWSNWSNWPTSWSVVSVFGLNPLRSKNWPIWSVDQNPTCYFSPKCLNPI